MTLKYESEILFDLMKRDGDDTPSDVLPYESELKEKYLHQVEGAYPKLQDYRPEWLNYNLNAHLPADFPVETLSNVTEATVDNVVPYAYRSAILKGQTLVNGFNNSHFTPISISFDTNTRTAYVEVNGRINTGVVGVKVYGKYSSVLKLQAEMKSTVIKEGLTHVNGMFKFDCSGDTLLKLMLYVSTPDFISGCNELINNIAIFEYQDGMENWDIPYFEGMQSVKMPVLSTVGKNLFNPTKMIINDGELYGYYKYKNDESVRCTLSISYKDTSVDISNIFFGTTASGKNADGDVQWLIANGYITQTKTLSIATNNNFISIYPNNTETLNKLTKRFNIQMEYGEVKTSYEPHKSNILSTTEEVTLRGIGDVKDTLNCLTGELTQRIGEVVLDGSENGWSRSAGNTNESRYAMALKIENVKLRAKTVNDRFVSGAMQDTDILNYVCGIASYNGIVIAVDNNKLETIDSSGFKKWLSQNPITVQYELATPAIKTVDLTVTDQDGNTESIIRPIEGTMHLMTEGDTIKPLFSGEIPVEATTQNLMSFANILEEE